MIHIVCWRSPPWYSLLQRRVALTGLAKKCPAPCSCWRERRRPGRSQRESRPIFRAPPPPVRVAACKCEAKPNGPSPEIGKPSGGSTTQLTWAKVRASVDATEYLRPLSVLWAPQRLAGSDGIPPQHWYLLGSPRPGTGTWQRPNVQGFQRDGDRGAGTYLPYLPCGSRGTSVPSYLRTSAVPSRSSIVGLDKGLSHPCRSLVEHLIFDLWSQPALPCSSSCFFTPLRHAKPVRAAGISSSLHSLSILQSSFCHSLTSSISI